MAKPFKLKDFFENPTEENIQRLKSMTINELMVNFKNSNTEDKQKFESQLIKLKVQKKHEKEVIPILKTITEISRFNSPVVKLKDYIMSENSTSSFGCDEDMRRQSSINNFVSHLIMKSNEMGMIDERKESNDQPVEEDKEEVSNLKNQNNTKNEVKAVVQEKSNNQNKPKNQN